MRVIFDIEANALFNPTEIWVVVCKDIDTEKYYIFRNITSDNKSKEEFLTFAKNVKLWVGHNSLGYDHIVLETLVGHKIERPGEDCLDTLILSRLIDYPRDSHSIEDYGLEFNYPKISFNNFSKYSIEMEERCIRDVDICHKIYLKYLKYINNIDRHRSIILEHKFQLIVNTLCNNGFSFNTKKAKDILSKVEEELNTLDSSILKAFPPRLKLVREVIPRGTKHGTIARNSIPKVLGEDLSVYTVDAPFSLCKWQEFNPSSHKQLIEVLTEAKWSPENKTKTHIDTERLVNKLKHTRQRTKSLDLELQSGILKLEELKKTGWKIDEKNLDTLPSSAPPPARLLAKRILLEARRRTLTEWLNLTWHEIKISKKSITTTGTETNINPIQSGVKNNWIEGNFGKEITPKVKNFQEESTTTNSITDLRSKTLIKWLKSKKINVEFARENKDYLWITVIGPEQYEDFCAIVATETWDGLNLRQMQFELTSTRIHGKFHGIGAWSHRMAHQNPNTANIPNDTDTQGKKKPYGKEMRSLWRAPKGRLLVGVDAEGIQLRIFAHYINDPEFTDALVKGKKDDKTDPHSLNQRILGSNCRSRAAAKRFIYALLLGAGINKLSEILGCSTPETEEALNRLLRRYEGFAKIKKEIIPLDARRGWFLGLDGRAVRIPGESLGARKHLAMSGYLQTGEAVVMKMATLKWADKLKDYDALLVNFVHDEWQVECPNNVEIALHIAKMQADSLEEVGRELNLNCPLAGSYWNDDAKDYTIGTNWSVTH